MNNTQSSPDSKSYQAQLKHIKQYMGKFSTAQPDVAKAFSALHQGAATTGQLDQKTKELIALAIAVVTRCDGCIAFHTHDALKAGASKDEIMEALSVAILMGGGPAMMYAVHVIEAVEEFEA
ncbi:MAG: carboxymuconolactone decarboxylase family protein [Cyanobacteria bacterium]|jgi:AhpD family alkylhydroperoxidase|nr:carboxymuconolactone decarboxylase family protein [Cyanobacteria bacterium GSL.Bin21]